MAGRKGQQTVGRGATNPVRSCRREGLPMVWNRMHEPMSSAAVRSRHVGGAFLRIGGNSPWGAVVGCGAASGHCGHECGLTRGVAIRSRGVRPVAQPLGDAGRPPVRPVVRPEFICPTAELHTPRNLAPNSVSVTGISADAHCLRAADGPALSALT